MQQVFRWAWPASTRDDPHDFQGDAAPRRCFLGEPPAPGFDRMLRGKLSVDDYLLPIDVEYPRFSREMCRLLRELHAEGRSCIKWSRSSRA